MDTWVISLPSRPERLAAFDSRARAVGMSYQLQPGIVPHSMMGWQGNRGSYGCALAHREILGNATDDVLIFEDDAILDKHLLRRLADGLKALPADWEILVLGGADFVYGETYLPPVHQVTRWHLSHAYAVSRRGLRHVLAANQGATLHWDHALAARLGPRGKAWMLASTLAQDNSLGSDIREG